MRANFYGKPQSTPLSILLLLVTVFSAGCGKQEESPATPSTTTSAPEAVVPIAAAETTGVSMSGRTNSGYALQTLRAVRVGSQPGADRIVFEFGDAGMPEWEVKYVEQPLLDCGSGEAVSVAGDAWLQITFRGAQAHTDAGEPTSDPRRRVVSQNALRELVRTCDFEGEVTWIAGVVNTNAYNPTVLAEPSRLVVDVSH